MGLYPALNKMEFKKIKLYYTTGGSQTKLRTRHPLRSSEVRPPLSHLGGQSEPAGFAQSHILVRYFAVYSVEPKELPHAASQIPLVSWWSHAGQLWSLASSIFIERKKHNITGRSRGHATGHVDSERPLLDHKANHYTVYFQFKQVITVRIWTPTPPYVWTDVWKVTALLGMLTTAAVVDWLISEVSHCATPFPNWWKGMCAGCLLLG